MTRTMTVKIREKNRALPCIFSLQNVQYRLVIVFVCLALFFLRGFTKVKVFRFTVQYICSEGYPYKTPDLLAMQGPFNSHLKSIYSLIFVECGETLPIDLESSKDNHHLNKPKIVTFVQILIVLPLLLFLSMTRDNF